MEVDLPGLMLVWAIGLVLYTGWIAIFLPRPWPLAEIILIACVGLWMQILLTEIILGCIGMLKPAWLLLANGLVLTLLWAYAAYTLRRSYLHTHWQAIRDTYTHIRACFWAQILLVLLVLWVLWTIVLGLIFPTYAFDEHYYHMPIVATILQEQRIGHIHSTIPWISAYPKNSELFVLWNSIFIHRDTVADLTMLPFGLVGGLGIYAAGRRLGASISGAYIASSVFVFCPVVLIQVKTTYNDILLGVFWAIALCLTLPPRNRHTYPGVWATAFVTGLLGGLIWGTKYTGMLYVPALALLLLQWLPETGQIRSNILIFLVFGVGVLLAGGYWYIFNLYTFDNPLWPFQIEIAGTTLFPGTMSRAEFAASDRSLHVIGNLSAWQKWLYTWSDRGEHFTVDSRLTGFGPLWVVAGLPGILMWACTAMFRRQFRIIGVICIHIGLLLVLPFNWMPRYTLFLIVLGGVSFAIVYTLLSPWAQRWAGLLVVLSTLLAMLGSINHTFFSGEQIRTFATLSDLQRTPAALDPARYGSGYQLVDQLIPPGSVLAYGNNVIFPYPLWGYAFQRRVIACTTIDPDQYVPALRSAGVQFVFLGAGGKQDAILSADQRASLLFAGDDGWKIFEVH